MAKPADTAKPIDAAKPIDVAKPIDAAKPANGEAMSWGLDAFVTTVANHAVGALVVLGMPHENAQRTAVCRNFFHVEHGKTVGLKNAFHR